MNCHFVQRKIRPSGTPLGRRFAAVIVMVIGLTCETFAATETVLVRFGGSTSGGRPLASLVFDKAGNLYGTASEGGAPKHQGCGVVFQLKARKYGRFLAEEVIYAFKGGTDGCTPEAGVIFDEVGNLYGTTSSGGSSGNGTVFELTPSPTGWTETVLYNFGGSGDGIAPSAPVIFDGAGNLYGTTSSGGSSGNGTVFELTPSPTGWTETVLYSFNCNYEYCLPSGVALDASGNLYATTYWGGVNGTGAVYEIVRSGDVWSGETLYSFTGGNDGGWPWAGVIPDSSGNLYGTTYAGGAYGWGARGGGTVFELSLSGTSWTENVLYSFQYPATPMAGLTFHGTSLYGTTSEGGPANAGDIFQLTPSEGGWTESVLYSFDPASNGASPEAAVIFDASGNLYGTTYDGGNSQNDGTVFEVVIAAATTTTLSSSPNPSTYGEAVTFTAVVTSSAGAPPDGEIITFTQGTTVLGTGTLSGGSASFTTSALPVGTNSITAVYGGDTNFAASTSKAVKQVVEKDPTTTTLSSSLNPSNYGQAVTFTATVTPTGPYPLTGNVVFKDGTTGIGTVTLSGGVATITKPQLAVGTHSITATYNGDAFNGKSVSAAITQTASQASVSMVLTSTPNPSTFGKSVHFTARLTSNGGVPTGQPVTFSYNGATLGTANVNSKGVATFSTTTLPRGSDAVTAAYAGSVDYSSASATVTQVVN